ncbi:unnamed protein product [Tilletia caries]|nr:unnamed protein product [Tilletia caries]
MNIKVTALLCVLLASIAAAGGFPKPDPKPDQTASSTSDVLDLGGASLVVAGRPALSLITGPWRFVSFLRAASVDLPSLSPRLSLNSPRHQILPPPFDIPDPQASSLRSRMNINIIALFCALVLSASIVAADDGDRGFHPHDENKALLRRGRAPHRIDPLHPEPPFVHPIPDPSLHDLCLSSCNIHPNFKKGFGSCEHYCNHCEKHDQDPRCDW